MQTNSLDLKAYLMPFVGFMGLMMGGQVVADLFEGQALWIIAQPQYWVMPLQALVCGAIVLRYWPIYQFERPRQLGLTLAVGLVVFLIWISPQELFGQAPRLSGFEPHFFASEGWSYHLNLGLRFLRLVVVVPLLEEIFWRGFLMRTLIQEPFSMVPFGQFKLSAFIWVTLFFALAHIGPDFASSFRQAALEGNVLLPLRHLGPDFVPALITGALYNGIACRTRSLSSCVLAHSLTNLLLGIYILRTGQWGFW